VNDVPYSNATSGNAAREETTKLLRRLGCDRIGWMDEYSEHAILLAFEHRQRAVQIRASAKGWAAMFLRAEPWNTRRRSPQKEYEAQALKQGLISVNSIVRDWVKGQFTAIECGIMSFEAAFLPHIVTGDGRTVIERVGEIALLPAPRQ
jgi:hypothetical protein